MTNLKCFCFIDYCSLEKSRIKMKLISQLQRLFLRITNYEFPQLFKTKSQPSQKFIRGGSVYLSTPLNLIVQVAPFTSVLDPF